MTRLVLSFSISSAVLILGLATAWIQSSNYDRAADLDGMQEELEWFERRSSGLRDELQRFEFGLHVQENASVQDRFTGGDG